MMVYHIRYCRLYIYGQSLLYKYGEKISENEDVFTIEVERIYLDVSP